MIHFGSLVTPVIVTLMLVIIFLELDENIFYVFGGGVWRRTIFGASKMKLYLIFTHHIVGHLNESNSSCKRTKKKDRL